MSRRSLRAALLFAPLALAVACSSPTNPRYPDPNPPTKPGQNPPTNAVQAPAPHDTVNVPAS
ncbi:MAG: hypothetical protein P8174_10465 [Gemmatimonadota bacterium]